MFMKVNINGLLLTTVIAFAVAYVWVNWVGVGIIPTPRLNEDVRADIRAAVVYVDDTIPVNRVFDVLKLEMPTESYMQVEKYVKDLKSTEEIIKKLNELGKE